MHACFLLASMPEALPGIDSFLCYSPDVSSSQRTGPVTILNWSFPRKDVSRAVQAAQLALALRKEMVDLEAAGCKVIQVWVLGRT